MVQIFAVPAPNVRAITGHKTLPLNRRRHTALAAPVHFQRPQEGTVQPFQLPTPGDLAHVPAPDLTVIGLVEGAASPPTALETEYLMTLYVPLERPLNAADNLKVWNIRSQGSWLAGPGINAKIVNPSGDWARVMPGGQIRVDVRLTLETEDGQIISVFYNGVVHMKADAMHRVMRGETITGKEAYFVVAPTFETRSEKYSWLNGVQAIGKMVSFQRGGESHVKYDIFRVK